MTNLAATIFIGRRDIDAVLVDIQPRIQEPHALWPVALQFGNAPAAHRLPVGVAFMPAACNLW